MASSGSVGEAVIVGHCLVRARIATAVWPPFMIRPGCRFSCRIERMRALVLVPRGFHLGHAGCYGNDWIATPALDRLAAEGVVFDQHFADRPDPAGACRAWRSGMYPFPPLPGEQPLTPPEQPDLLALL